MQKTRKIDKKIFKRCQKYKHNLKNPLKMILK